MTLPCERKDDIKEIKEKIIKIDEKLSDYLVTQSEINTKIVIKTTYHEKFIVAGWLLILGIGGRLIYVGLTTT